MSILDDLHRQHKARYAKFFPPKPPRIAAPEPPPEPEPAPAPKPALPPDVIDLTLERLIRNAEKIALTLTWPQPQSEAQIRIRDVIEAVCDFYQIHPTHLLSQRRTMPLTRWRQTAMFLAVRLTGKSLPEIGRRFSGRDHTTVLHAMRRIETLRRTDQRLNDEIQLILMRLCERFAVSPAREGQRL